MFIVVEHPTSAVLKMLLNGVNLSPIVLIEIFLYETKHEFLLFILEMLPVLIL